MLLAAAVAAAAGAPVSGISAQEAAATHMGSVSPAEAAKAAVWFPARSSFAPLLAAPREVALRGGFLVADREERGGDFRGSNVEADVALGHRLPVVRLQRAAARRPELTLGFEVGVFPRFFMETPQKDLIAADFRVGAPLSARWRGWRARLTLRHVSSHLGDDFVERFDPPARQATRDGLELLVARHLGVGLRLYGGGEWNFHVNEGVERTAARAGVEWDPDPRAPAGSDAGGGEDPPPRGAETDVRGPGGGGLQAWPFAAGDVRVTSVDDAPAASAAGGLAFRVEGVVLRLEGRLHAGPTPLGRLRGRDETSAGLGLRVEP